MLSLKAPSVYLMDAVLYASSAILRQMSDGVLTRSVTALRISATLLSSNDTPKPAVSIPDSTLNIGISPRAIQSSTPPGMESAHEACTVATHLSVSFLNASERIPTCPIGCMLGV